MKLTPAKRKALELSFSKPYQRKHADGDLLVMGRSVMPVAELVGVALDRWGRPARIVADYHHERELRQALDEADEAKFPPAVPTTARRLLARGHAQSGR